MRKYLILAVSACVIGAGWFVWSLTGNGYDNVKTRYRLAKIEKRDLVRSISATGTLSAVVTVDVGSQISGQISQILVDYNSPVKKGQVIAQIDPLNHEALVRQAQAELDLYKAKVASQEASVLRAQAELDSAESNLIAAKAAVSKSQASLKKAKQDMERSQNLVKNDFIAKTEYDTDLTTFHEAKAEMDKAQAQERAAQSAVKAKQATLVEQRAQIEEIKAQVRLKKASLDNRQVDLDHTIIRSPVDGVVIDRAIDVGQTVAASLQAPVLFTIAQDLKDMEVAASVDESDIGSIREGQEAYFTVDAFGTRKFTGQVKQIRKASTTVQNVVTYTVVIAAPNHDLSLLPGMTADVRVILDKRSQVLSVPDKALRFKPADNEVVTAAGSQAGGAAAADTGQARSGSGSSRLLTRLTEALGLSAGQQEQIRAGLKEVREKAKQTVKRPMGPPVSKSDQRNAMRMKIESIIMNTLTPAQRDKYTLLKKQRSASQASQGTLYLLDQEGRLAAYPVRIGISDGSYSEIRGRNLKLGQEVVMGRQ
ncbi:MAG: HlyD family efflux transporter periplasmic adaptor subunit [Desulfarculaceae bacterium]|jgi:HlyD family secretion protein